MAGSEPSRRVVVAGSINMDVVATAPHHPGRGETVLGTALRFLPGGKGANQAVAAARHGACTTLFGRVGSDAFGDSLRGFLSGEAITLEWVSCDPAAPTGTALIVVAGAENTIVVVPGANAELAAADVGLLALGPSDVVVAQFEIPLQVVEGILAKAKQAGATTILNPAPMLDAPASVFESADVLVVNEVELGALAGAPAPSSPAVALDLAARARRGAQTVVATLGPLGAVAAGPGDARYRVDGLQVHAVDTTGAGDCFVGTLAASIAEGLEFGAALEEANVAAALSVQRPGAGASMPTRAEVSEARRQ